VNRSLPLVVAWAKTRSGKPFHYSEAVEVVKAETGRSDANLSKIVLRGISRSRDFERISRGTYRYRGT
jgi:hypothetical protein